MGAGGPEGVGVGFVTGAGAGLHAHASASAASAPPRGDGRKTVNGGSPSRKSDRRARGAAGAATGRGGKRGASGQKNGSTLGLPINPGGGFVADGSVRRPSRARSGGAAPRFGTRHRRSYLLYLLYPLYRSYPVRGYS